MKRNISWVIGLILLFVIITAFFASSEELTQAQKERYYQEYLKIGKELREEYPDSLSFKMVEIEKIKEKDWVKPKQYRNKIIPIITKEKGIVDLPFVSFDVRTSKNKQILSDDNILADIVIDSTVTVTYDADLGHPIINDISNVKSYTKSNYTQWEQVSSKFSNVNNNNTLTVFGHVTFDKTTFPEAIEVSFSFNKQGFIQ